MTFQQEITNLHYDEKFFLELIKKPSSFSISESVIISFLKSRESIKTVQSHFVCALLCLNKEEFLFNYLTNNHPETIKHLEMSGIQFRSFKNLRHHLFNLDCYSLLSQHQPSLIPNLFTLQKRLYHRDHIDHYKFVITNYREQIRDLQPFEKFACLEHSLNFLLFIHDQNIIDDEFSFPFSSVVLDFLLFVCELPHTFLFNNQKIKTLTLDGHAPYFKMFYSILKQRIERYPAIERRSELFQILFSSPLLCSFAFKENNKIFLPFCDVENAMTKDPEFFLL